MLPLSYMACGLKPCVMQAVDDPLPVLIYRGNGKREGELSLPALQVRPPSRSYIIKRLT